MEAESEQMTQKQALKEALDEIQKNLTEIERLKESLHEAGVRNGKLVLLKPLISELCDALESIPIVLHPPHRELVQRAREATR